MLRTLAVVAALGGPWGGVALAQEVPAAWKADPYTRGERAAMDAAGYVSYGPFPWDDRHDTVALQKLLHDEPLLFVETAHFRIGSSLVAFRQPKAPPERRMLVADLEDLRKVLPRVEPRARVLDPWLRLHLFARRLEKHYQRVSADLGVDDAQFARPTSAEGAIVPKGDGPYLGMRDKFLVLMLRKKSNLGRYTNSVADRPQPEHLSHTHHFLGRGSLFVGTATELCDGRLFHDHVQHCHLLYMVTQSLVLGFKGYRFRPPAWLIEGVAHYYVHDLDPYEHHYRPMEEGMPVEQQDPRWDRKVRGLVQNAAFRPLGETMGIEHAEGLNFLDHMTSWSRVEFLIREKPQAFARLLDLTKEAIDRESGVVPPAEKVIAQHRAALERAFGGDAAAFDAAWSKWVLRTYRRK